MLVKKSVVEKWYQTDSWVYKNFSYLFQNPLWSKTIPRGFSVCPYFWMSMFSLLFFRPFIVSPIKYFIMPLVNLIGKPARVVDGWGKSILTKIGADEGRLDELPTGVSIALTLGVIGLVASLLLMVCVGAVKLAAFYATLEGIRLGIFAFWSCLSFAGMWLTLFIHKTATDTDCKTMNYLWVWLALFLGASGVFIPTEMIHGIGVMFSGIGGFLAWAGVGIWNGICISAPAIWSGLVWLAKVVWSGIMWKPLAALVLPWWGFVVIISTFGWSLDRFYVWYDKRNTEILREENPEELYARNRSAWVSLFTRILMLGEHWKKGECFKGYSGYFAAGCKRLGYDLFRSTFERMWKDKLDILQADYPMLNNDGWKLIQSTDGSSARFNVLIETLDGKCGEFFFESNIFERYLKEVINSVPWKNEIDVMVKEYEQEAKRKAQRREDSKNAWSHLMCLKVTSGIGSTVSSIGRGIRSMWQMVCYFFSQLWTLLAYLWMLVKAKKQGVCPYFTFTDPTKKP